ncbi:hypothetical protein ES705_14776 [subsurface metagenome]
MRLFFLLVFLPLLAYSQEQITISKPTLELVGSKLIIEYDISNSDPSDFFIIWIEVSDSHGNKISALSLSGDHGDDVRGGRNKSIIWDLEKDNVLLNEQISIEIKAEKKAVAASSPERTGGEPLTSERKISRGDIIFSSMLFPGLGQTRNSGGKPYWIMGVAFYGCIAGSVYMSRVDLEESEINQDKISKALGYSAIGIWAINMVWAFAMPVEDGNQAYRQVRRIQFNPGYDPVAGNALLTLSYRF